LDRTIYNLFLSMKLYDPIERSEELVEAMTGVREPFSTQDCMGIHGFGREYINGTKTRHVALVETVGCNVSCAHCYVPNHFLQFHQEHEHFQRSLALLPEPKILHTAAEIRVALESSLREGGVDVGLSSGEPTLFREGLVELAHELWKYNRKVHLILNTNGILVAEFPEYLEPFTELSRKQRREQIMVGVSLKGASAGEYENFTQTHGKYWQHPYHALRKFYEAGIPALPQFTLNIAGRTSPDQELTEDDIAESIVSLVRELRAVHEELPRLAIPQEVNQYRVPYKPEVVRKRFQKRGGYRKTKPSIALKHFKEAVPDWIPSGRGEAPALETKVPIMRNILKDYGW